jgi:hypothetical protein
MSRFHSDPRRLESPLILPVTTSRLVRSCRTPLARTVVSPLVDVTIGPAVWKFPSVPVYDGIAWLAWPVLRPGRSNVHRPLWAVLPISGPGPVQPTR